MPPAPRFARIAGPPRETLVLSVDGRRIEALEGDSVLTALMHTVGFVRAGEFGDGPRAGFCCMGACQDCWVALSGGPRLRACTTLAERGMEILTGQHVDG